MKPITPLCTVQYSPCALVLFDTDPDDLASADAEHGFEAQSVAAPVGDRPHQQSAHSCCAPPLPDHAAPFCQACTALDPAEAGQANNSPDHGTDDFQRGVFCCVAALRAALARLCPRYGCWGKTPAQQNKRVRHRAFKRRGRRASRASLQRPYRLASVPSNAEAPYPLERADFRLVLAEALTQLKTETDGPEGAQK